MLSISHPKHAGGAISYFSVHLVEENASNPNEDYYTAHGEAGQWLGSGAEAIGFEGEVTAEDFGRALLGIDRNGEELVQNANDPSRRSGWDLTFSAPKSVSTLWAAGDDQLHDSIARAHAEAVGKAMDYLQHDGGIAGRRGKGGLELENSKLVAAKFDHGTSREQDPQLHTHTFVMNLAQRQDGSWGAIQSFEILKRKKTAGAIYRAHLASEMQKMGFGIEQKAKGLFEVADVSEDLQKHWSKRRKQVEKAMFEKGGSSAKSAEAAALSTRSQKEEVDQTELTQGWKEQAESFGVTIESIKELQEKDYEAIKMQSIDEIWSELTSQESTVSEHKLKAKIFEKAAGALSVDQAEQFVIDFIKSDETIILRDPTGNKRFTSREMYQLEQSLMIDAKARQNESHALDKDSVDKALAKVPTISDEQKKYD
jgi:conjugative relaxase-like TrwC/TraI family protein